MCMQLKMWRRWFAFLIATAVCWPQIAEAQPPSEPGLRNAPIKNAAPANENYFLRTYEVGDLILNIQDHPYSESMQRTQRPSGGGGFFSVPDNLGGVGGLFGGGSSGLTARFVKAGDATARIQLCQFGGGGGGGGLGSGTGAEPQPAGASITIDDLRRVLTTTVASESWAINGTGEGQVEPLGTALVVWQSPEVHGLIDRLLKQIREGSADRKTVMIDARWLMLNSDELDGLLLRDKEGVQQIDRKLLDEYTRRPGSMRGMTNCFSGQLVYLVSGTIRNIVTGYIPVVGSLESPDRGEQLASGRGEPLIRFVSDTPAVGGGKEPKVGYQPIVENPNFGALLEIRPTLIPIHPEAMVVVDLKSTLTVPGAQSSVSSNDSMDSASIAPQVDRIAIETQEFATTVRIPLGKPVLVGGLTYLPGSTGPHDNRGEDSVGHAEGATAETPQLYFVLEVR